MSTAYTVIKIKKTKHLGYINISSIFSPKKRKHQTPKTKSAVEQKQNEKSMPTLKRNKIKGDLTECSQLGVEGILVRHNMCDIIRYD